MMAKKTRKKAKPAKAAKRKPARAKVTRKIKKAKTTASKSRKKAKKAPAKATRAVAKKAKRPAAKKAKRSARKTKDVIGEGNYTASRNFRKTETAFVKKNRKKIPAMAKAAEAALEGPQGAELEAARKETAARGQE
jgi:hypothetical protein